MNPQKEDSNDDDKEESKATVPQEEQEAPAAEKDNTSKDDIGDDRKLSSKEKVEDDSSVGSIGSIEEGNLSLNPALRKKVTFHLHGGENEAVEEEDEESTADDSEESTADDSLRRSPRLLRRRVRRNRQASTIVNKNEDDKESEADDSPRRSPRLLRRRVRRNRQAFTIVNNNDDDADEDEAHIQDPAMPALEPRDLESDEDDDLPELIPGATIQQEQRTMDIGTAYARNALFNPSEYILDDRIDTSHIFYRR